MPSKICSNKKYTCIYSDDHFFIFSSKLNFKQKLEDIVHIELNQTLHETMYIIRPTTLIIAVICPEFSIQSTYDITMKNIPSFVKFVFIRSKDYVNFR